MCCTPRAPKIGVFLSFKEWLENAQNWTSGVCSIWCGYAACFMVLTCSHLSDGQNALLNVDDQHDDDMRVQLRKLVVETCLEHFWYVFFP